VAKVFISYSHRDEKALERLHKHLAMLRRELLITAWYDREILPGGHIDREVAIKLTESEIFLALVSPDFLHSNYCYEREMQTAIKLADEGRLQIIPVILEPCDWKASPLVAYKALPKDGQPISLWSNQNVAFLDVVTEIRRSLESRTQTAANSNVAISQAITRAPAHTKYRVKRDFSSIDRAEFRESSYRLIQNYFKASTDELNKIGHPIQARFEDMSSNSFTCTVINRARNRGEGHITVHNQPQPLLGDITYTFSAHGPANSASGSFSIEANEFELYLKASLGFGLRDSDRPITAEQAAELLWDHVLEEAGIDYASD
jgi:TIR domain